MQAKELIEQMKAFTMLVPVTSIYVYEDHISLYCECEHQVAWIKFLTPLGKVDTFGSRNLEFKPLGLKLPHDIDTQERIEEYLKGRFHGDPFTPKS